MITRSNVEALLDEQIAAGIIEGAIAKSAVLSKFRRLPNMTSNKTKMRVLDSLPMAYWVGKTDNGRKKLTKMAWDNKYIVAEEIAVIVPIKEDLLDDVSFDIWGMIRPRVEEAFGKKIDDAILLGIDKPDGFRTDLLTSILNASATVQQGENENLYSAVNNTMAKVEESGYNVTGIVGGVDIKSKFRMLLDTSGQPVTGTEIGDLIKNAYYVTNGVWDKSKSQMIVGDFNEAVYAIRQDITYKMLDQAVIQDPASGEILYNLAQEDMVALRVVMRLGWEIPNPINALNPDESIRFPFASLAPASSTLTTQTVTVTVKDNAGSPAPIAGAKVTVGGLSKKTNASGVATFKLQTGEYPMMVKKDDMVATDVVTVASSAVNKAVTLK